MDRDAAVARVHVGLGFRTDMTDQIVLHLQEEQRDLERGKTLPSFMLLEGQTLNLLEGTRTVAIPADFLRRSNEQMYFYPPTGDGRSRYIPWREYAAARTAYESYEAAGPVVAALRTSTIEFFPTADRDYPITWDYYQKGIILTSNVENLWLQHAPELLIGGAGLRLSRDLRNQAGEKLFGQMYQTARTTWFAETVVEDTEDLLVLGGNA